MREEIDYEKLAAGSRRARDERHKGRPVRAHRESHPTAMRNLLLLVGIVVLLALAAVRIIQFVH